MEGERGREGEGEGERERGSERWITPLCAACVCLFMFSQGHKKAALAAPVCLGSANINAGLG